MKNRNLFNIIILCLLAVICTGCTQPDGNIGDWFGSWYLEEMLIDGEIDSEYAEDKASNERLQILISFQSNVFNVAYLNGSAIFGTWSYAGETLTLIASYDAGSGNVSPYFDPYPIVMHFPKGVEELEITVTRLESRRMQWQRIDPQGRLITYNFKKYP